MFIINFIVESFLNSAIILLFCVGSIIIAGLILGVLKNIISRYIQYAIGWGGIILTGWIGTPIHELGHAAMCLVFGHKIKSMKLFPSGEDSQLGFVQHSYNRNNFFHKVGNFFIGIGPILSGTVVILTLLFFLLPDQFSDIKSLIKVYSKEEFFSMSIVHEIIDMPSKLFHILFTLDNFKNFRFWIFIIMAISVASHMALSTSDMKGAFSGLISLYLMAFLINLVSPIFKSESDRIINIIITYNSYMIFALMVAIFCSICSAVLAVGLYSIKNMMEE